MEVLDERWLEEKIGKRISTGGCTERENECLHPSLLEEEEMSVVLPYATIFLVRSCPSLSINCLIILFPFLICNYISFSSRTCFDLTSAAMAHRELPTVSRETCVTMRKTWSGCSIRKTATAPNNFPSNVPSNTSSQNPRSSFLLHFQIHSTTSPFASPDSPIYYHLSRLLRLIRRVLLRCTIRLTQVLRHPCFEERFGPRDEP
jgi:hypothetical protein